MKDLIITMSPLCAAIYAAALKEKFNLRSSMIGLIVSVVVSVAIWADYYFCWGTRLNLIAGIMAVYDLALLWVWIKTKSKVRGVFYITYFIANLIFVFAPLFPLRPVSFLAMAISLMIGIPYVYISLCRERGGTGH